MGSYNRLHVLDRCIQCDKINRYIVQYKHGELGFFNYLIGEKIITILNENCTAVAEGYPEKPCYNCKAEPVFDVIIQDANIVKSIQRLLVDEKKERDKGE